MCRVRRVSTGTATTPTEGPAPGADVDQASGSSSETSDTPLTMAVTVSATALPAAVVNHMVEHTQAIEPHAVIEIQETEQISLPENSAGIALIKTPTALRSTMKEDRLNSLALLKCHREINIDPEEVVEEFSHRHPRRMLLTNPFAD